MDNIGRIMERLRDSRTFSTAKFDDQFKTNKKGIENTAARLNKGETENTASILMQLGAKRGQYNVDDDVDNAARSIVQNPNDQTHAELLMDINMDSPLAKSISAKQRQSDAHNAQAIQNFEKSVKGQHMHPMHHGPPNLPPCPNPQGQPFLIPQGQQIQHTLPNQWKNAPQQHQGQPQQMQQLNQGPFNQVIGQQQHILPQNRQQFNQGPPSQSNQLKNNPPEQHHQGQLVPQNQQMQQFNRGPFNQMIGQQQHNILPQNRQQFNQGLPSQINLLKNNPPEQLNRGPFNQVIGQQQHNILPQNRQQFNQGPPSQSNQNMVEPDENADAMKEKGVSPYL